MKYTSSILTLRLIVFFLSLFYSQALQSQSPKRYYFSTYHELVKFFEQPTNAGITFVSKPTEFYADVYKTKTLTEAITACLFQDEKKGIAHAKSTTISYGQKNGLLVIGKNEIPQISFKTGSYKQNLQPSSSRDQVGDEAQEGNIPWKIIAPNGEVYGSQEYDAQPDKFEGLWRQPVSLPHQGSIPYRADLVERDDGSSSLKVSLGDFNVCDQYRATSDRMNEHHRVAVRQHQHKFCTPPHVLLQEAQNRHHGWIKTCIKSAKHAQDMLARQCDRLLSLNPPLVPIPTASNGISGGSYNKALETQGWLYNKIEKLTMAFERPYRNSFFGMSTKDLNAFIQAYDITVDRIVQEFYRRCPPPPSSLFTAICLSHKIVQTPDKAACMQSTCNAYALELLQNWKSEYQNIKSHGDTQRVQRLEQRLHAAQAVINSKGLTFNYASQLKNKDNLGDDKDSAIFNNYYGTALDQQLHEELCEARQHIRELSRYYTSSEYPALYVPIISRVTSLAKQEQDLGSAFNLADCAHDLVTILSKGLSYLKAFGIGLANTTVGTALINTTIGVGKGMVDAAKTVIDPRHWVDMITGFPVLIVHSLVFLTQEMIHRERMKDAFLSDDKVLFESFVREKQVQLAKIEEHIKNFMSMTCEDVGHHAGYFGTLFVLDGVALYSLKHATTAAGRKVVTTIAEFMESPNAPHHMIEVAGIGKIAVEEGMGAAYKAAETVAERSSRIRIKNNSFILPAQKFKDIIYKKLKYVSDNTWQSPKGVVYGYDGKFGNSLNHMLTHTKPDPLKAHHTIFNVPREKIIDLIDEAWTLKGIPLAKDPLAYIVDMKKIIGTQGERAIRIVVKTPGSSQLRTAYPVELKGIF
jgi:hypothetical protein